MTDAEFYAGCNSQIREWLRQGERSVEQEDKKLRLDLVRSLLLNDALTIAKFGLTEHIAAELRAHYTEYQEALK